VFTIKDYGYFWKEYMGTIFKAIKNKILTRKNILEGTTYRSEGL